jgi:cytidine deaminase
MALSTKLNKTVLDQAWKLACETRLRAHAPYSKFLVGAALVLEGNELIGGCNVENASYGGTVCAERTALFAAIAQKGKIKPIAMVLVTEPAEVPCGICLQAMVEFMPFDAPIYLSDTKGVQKSFELKELLPHTFSAESLK